ncbi:MAG TPA: hypothetical protein VG269_06295 [Tepidisphaeraceae bacterium]|jgi:hypothetical protein|nr:hypothetical protein [Tepidisphaeraceae bacterium]
MRFRPLYAAAFAALAFSSAVPTVRGHGIVGNRFFPPTVSTDDPFAADELAFPTLSYVKNAAGDGSPASHEIDAGFEFDKLILPKLSLGVSDTYVAVRPDQGPSSHGWTDLTLNLKYQVWQNDEHEAVVAVGASAEIGGTGSKHADANSFTTFEPTFYFGKGFGDLPESLAVLQPFAVTGVVGQTFPTRSADPNVLEWGFALEYSLPYLQQHVQDVGLPAPFKDMIPLVEFAMQTAENRDQGGLTTGTINPGVLWESPYLQVGVEANIPINNHSGTHVGVTVQAWIYIDDLFPRVFGHPIFGENP